MPAYNDSKTLVVGKCSLTLYHKNNFFEVSFLAVDSDSVPILRFKTSEHLQLIKIICIIETNCETFFSEFHDCLGEIGTLNTTHHIDVKGNVKLVVTPVRKVPHAFKAKLEKELKRMVDLDIIDLIDKPTDWVNGLLIVEKPNEKLRICLDPRPLNNAIKREHFHLSTFEEIFTQMSGACFFSKLDASSGYWQMKVGEEGSHLLAFGIPLGRYCFKRLPYRIHSASDVFQQEIISDVSDNANSQDDIIVWGRTLVKHDERLNNVFFKFLKSGLKLNKKKCQIGVKSILFLRHIISLEGVKVDPAKTETITKMLLP